MNKDDVTKVRDEIIRSALPDVMFDGWSWAVVCSAAAKAGYSEGVGRAVFPSRMTDVLDAFADLADREMLAMLLEHDPKEISVRERIKTALMARFRFLEAHQDALRQSVKFWAVPSRKARAAKIVWRTADRIWIYAGDEARDYNHYTKRGLLSGIIVSATLFWLNNNGDAQETLDSLEGFIDRRIANVMQLGRIIGRFKKAS